MASLLFLPIAPLIPARRRVATSHTSARRPRMDVSETLGESLVRSAMLTDESSIRTLLKSGAPVSYASQLNASNMTALMWAASEGSASITQLLLSNDADVDATNAQGFTALLYAFENLTSSNPRAPPPEGYPNDPGRRAPPRQIPVGPRTTGHDAVCQLLVDAGADVRVRNAFGETLLHLAAKKCGDEAYECRNWLITPYARSQCNDKEKYFNFFLSSHRVHIEQAFGHLVARWRVLNGGLEFSLSRNIRVVCACMKLHNLCIEQGESFDSVRNELNSHGGTVEEVQAWYEEAKEHRQSSQSFSRTRSPARSIKRDKLRDLVWDLRKV